MAQAQTQTQTQAQTVNPLTNFNWQNYIQDKHNRGIFVIYPYDISILAFMDSNVVLDVWRNEELWKVKLRCNIPTKVCDTYIETFKSKSSFMDFCWQKRDMQVPFKSIKDFKIYSVPFKSEYKNPVLARNIKVEAEKINLFTPGWLSEALDDPNIPSQLTPALTTLLDNLFGKDDQTRHWTLQWMRNFMHNFQKMMTAVVFWGDPGCGKSMIAECFGAAIGDFHSPKQNQIEDVRFNTWVNHAVLILDEVSCGSKKDGKSFGDYLKSLITQPIQSVEGKCKDIMLMKINNCYLFTSNVSTWIVPLFIENKDRRYTIVCNENSKNLRNDKLWSQKDFDDWDSGYLQKVLMKYIYNLPEDKNISVNYGVENGFKEKIQQRCKNYIEQLVEEFITILQEEWTKNTISNAEIEEILKENCMLDGKQTQIRTIKKILIQQYNFTDHRTATHRGLLIPVDYYKNDLPKVNNPTMDNIFYEPIGEQKIEEKPMAVAADLDNLIDCNDCGQNDEQSNIQVNIQDHAEYEKLTQGLGVNMTGDLELDQMIQDIVGDR